MFIPELNSTNDYLKHHPELGSEEELFGLRTDYQTAGRGQQGNGWESERGKNLLCSIRWRNTGIRAEEAFRINEIVAVAIVLAPCSIVLAPCSIVLAPFIKWPNDIYIGDRKVAGLLVENTFSGGIISESIIGIGLNLNQTTFTSAPNPTSLYLETGQTWEPEQMMQQVLASFREVMTWPQEQLRHAYMSHLYRKEGFYPYCEREVSAAPSNPLFEPASHRSQLTAHNSQLTAHNSQLTAHNSQLKAQSSKLKARSFTARIVEVTPQGELVLERQDGMRKTYHFKQIQYILPCKQ